MSIRYHATKNGEIKKCKYKIGECIHATEFHHWDNPRDTFHDYMLKLSDLQEVSTPSDVTDRKKIVRFRNNAFESYKKLIDELGLDEKPYICIEESIELVKSKGMDYDKWKEKLKQLARERAIHNEKVREEKKEYREIQKLKARIERNEIEMATASKKTLKTMTKSAVEKMCKEIKEVGLKHDFDEAEKKLFNEAMYCLQMGWKQINSAEEDKIVQFD